MRDLTRFAWLSVAAALATIAVKSIAYLVTGSVGLMSDAVESLVNLAGAVGALIALRVAAKPADHDHEYGHTKAEYFSAVMEGAMVFVAAVVIIVASIERLLNPSDIERVGVGLAISVAATLVNLVVGLVLIRAGRRHRSITLIADGRHLMTDVWTTAGVLAGVALVWLSGWWWLDPVVAILVALNILRTGFGLIAESVSGLMDAAMEGEDRAAVDAILDHHRSRADGIDVHEIRTRVSGRRRFIEFHVLVPGRWSVDYGHEVLTRMEEDLRRRFPGVHISSHLEPIEDARAYGDVDL